jgi:transcriptional regulator of acetoin/glycerol metabolism
VKKRISRNAGRKIKYVYKETTVAEVRTRMHTEPAEQIAKDLGLSRSTLFRKLKYAEENGNDTLC